VSSIAKRVVLATAPLKKMLSIRLTRSETRKNKKNNDSLRIIKLMTRNKTTPIGINQCFFANWEKGYTSFNMIRSKEFIQKARDYK
jgi:hypothetical protein